MMLKEEKEEEIITLFIVQKEKFDNNKTMLITTSLRIRQLCPPCPFAIHFTATGKYECFRSRKSLTEPKVPEKEKNNFILKIELLLKKKKFLIFLRLTTKISHFQFNIALFYFNKFLKNTKIFVNNCQINL